MKHLRQFFLNAFTLTAVSLLMRTVAVAFNAYISNKVGAEAMGLYSLFSGVYGFALTFSTAGLQLAATRTVTEAIGRENRSAATSALKACCLWGFGLSLLASLSLYALAPTIGHVWLGDERVIRPLRVLSLTLVPISLSSVLSGYFNAVRRVYKNAATQIWEQGVKIYACIALLSLLPGDIEHSCMALVLSGVIAEGASFLALLILFLWDRKRHALQAGGAITPPSFGGMLQIALPVAISANIRSALVSLEHTLIPRGLRKNGLPYETALASYGALRSMALPVVLFPSALIGSFAGLLIPEFTECQIKGHHRHISYMATRVLHLSLLFSIGVAGIMLCFSLELGQTIYRNAESALFIKALAPLIPVMYLDTTVDSMLKGLGEQVYSMNVNILDASLSVLLVFWLVPLFGIQGYVITIFISELVNAAFSITRLLNISRIHFKLGKWVWKPLLSVVGATALTNLLVRRSVFPLPDGLSLTLHILLSTALYLLLLYLTSALDKEDIQWMISVIKKEKSE